MEIRSLDGLPRRYISEIFNEAFSDYSVKVSYTEEGFRDKVIGEGINLQYSPGAFVDEKLVGFILHGLDEVNGRKLVFNAGTGVVPSFRGNRVVEQLYNYILPRLAAVGYRHHQLEVIEDNLKALKTYEKVGFRVKRTVTAFKGMVKVPPPGNIKLNEVDEIDWTTAQSFWNVLPTWQNNIQSILRLPQNHKFITAMVNGQFAGYAIVDRSNGRLKQFGVKKEHRRTGIGKALLSSADDKDGQVVFTNYDESDEESLMCFTSLGLNSTVRLHEMTMEFID